jgi:hypothetical protein
VLAWHPWWPDFKALTKELAHSFSQPSLRLLLLSNESSALSLSLTDRGERVHKIRGVQFLRQTPDYFTPLNGTFDLCLLELSEADLINDGARYVKRIVPLMKNGGQIIVSVENRRVRFKTREFSANVAFQSTRLITSGVLPTEVNFVPLNPVRLIFAASNRWRCAMVRRAISHRRRRLSAHSISDWQLGCIATKSRGERTGS